ncbi:MAG: response regulator [Acaryochloridaceae cyanobacterium RU_4_10]|nr:response regulator [Acaryochloridaceae cyanobacterium RU_4_10]
MKQPQRTVLLIDDSPEDREFYRRCLLQDKEYNYTILESKLGRAGLEQWQYSQPNAVILDYRLPDLNGLEVLAAFRNQTHCDFLPVVMVTGQGDEAIAVQAMKAGAQDYLVKEQLTPAGLRLAVNAAIETVALRTQLQQSLEREQLVAQISQHIYQSMNLQEILQTTVTEVRQLLKSDRALIFQLQPEGRGTVVVESVGSDWTPLLSRTFHDPCLEESHLQPYRQGLAVSRSDIYDGSTNPCHVDFLAQLQVRANLVVPIVRDDLWGMLIVHHCAAPRHWQPFEIDLLEQLSTQVGIAIQQAELYEQAQQELTERKRAEASLRLAHEELESQVQTRTWELNQTVDLLQQEIRDRKQAVETIREQATLIDISPDAIFVRDLNCHILFWNKGAEQIYGWTSDEIVGKDSCELLIKPPSSQLDIPRRAVLSVGEWQGELTKVTKSGQKIIVFSRWILMRDEAGEPKSILTVEIDVTAQKQLEQQFLRTQRLESLGTLASGIAHDLNNILTPILGTAQLLPVTLPSLDEQNRKLLQLLSDSASRGSNLVNQILFFAKGTEGKRITLQVAHLLREVRQLVSQTFPKSIDIQIYIPEELWMITGDATQLHQVLMNLCLNARDAMPDGGVLSLSTENLWIDEQYAQIEIEAKVGPYLVITISDTGTGIPKNILDRIFDPFFTTKEPSKGTGLGLSTVIGIVKSYGGFVKISSKVGEGTQFKVFLPAAETTNMSPPEDCPPVLGNGEAILVVDDETPILTISKETLQIYNYRVLTANNGIDAIAQYAQHQDDISLVLMDMMMPEMGGETTIRTLQLMNPQVKIIASSGIVSNKELAEAVGAKAFLSKPFTSDDLLNTLHRVLLEE